MNAEWLAATWADVGIDTVVRDVDGRVGEVMSVQTLRRRRPRGFGLEIEVLAPDGSWCRKQVEAANFVEIEVCP
ncbi:MAG: hypothetical protein M3063_06995 [Actinomycetota bacterium]|nr:hypothetical protein [Actinomycetota bacterium]